MYHFTIIDEASLENEQIGSKMQENNNRKAESVSKKDSTLPKRTSLFLHRYLEKTTSVRMFINND